MVATGVLVVGDIGSSIFKRKLTLANVIGDRVETQLALLDGLGRDTRLAQDVTHVHLVASLVDELDDVVAKLRLHNLRHLLRVGETKSDIGKLRHPLGATAIA